MDTKILSSKIQTIEENLQKELNNLIKTRTSAGAPTDQAGRVTDFADGVGHVGGLPNAKIGQKFIFPDSTERAQKLSNVPEEEIFGLAVDVDEDSIGIMAFGEEKFIKQGDSVEWADDLLTIPVTERMLGRVLDPLCRPLDGMEVPEELNWLEKDEKGRDKVKEGILTLPIERKAPSVIDRSKINEAMQTGVKSIDAMLPIGRGQRMLVIGDRATGKTAVGIDTIVNQNNINRRLNNDKPGFNIHNIETHDLATVYCIYVAIGRKASEIRQLKETLKAKDALEYTTIIAAMANDPAPLLFISPFSGCTLGEYFRERGRHALIIYDDLSKHANAYRQISLLLRRPPGREAFPGDIFYLHSRLLERGAKTCGKQGKPLDFKEISEDFKAVLRPFQEKGVELFGGGSLTVLPYVETKQNDFAAYVPTNIISITDGQVYLSDKLFNEGFRPAINIGISVSRVGSKAQTAAMKEVSDGLKGYLANFREKEKYTKFGLNPSEADIQVLERGRRIIHFLKQPQFKPVDVEREVIGLFTIRKGFFDILPDSEKLVKEFEEYTWENLTKNTEIYPKILEFRNPKTDITSSNVGGVLFVERLSEIVGNYQLEFLKKHKFPRYDILSTFVPDFNKIITTFLERFNTEIDKHLKVPQSLSGTVIASFFSLIDSIPQGLRHRDFSRTDQAPKELRINDFKPDILKKFMFSYLIEERQKLRRDFCVKIEKEIQFTEEGLPETDKKKIAKFSKEFFLEDKDHPESEKRMRAIKEKGQDYIKSYVAKQLAEVQKLKNFANKQKKHVDDNKNDPKLKIDEFNKNFDNLVQNLNKLYDALKDVVRTLDKIDNFMQS